MSTDADHHERLPDPELFVKGPLRLATRVLRTGDLRADRAQLRRLRTFAQAEDPLADAVVRMIERRPRGRGRAQFERALTQGIESLNDPPDELWEFFNEVESRPYWVDFDRLERGARVITRTGLIGMVPLGDMSLMGGYLASRAVKTLVGTGDLE